MAKQTEHGIVWTDQTWNPVRGCSRVSEGCRNCYAERVAARFSDRFQPYEGLARRTPSGPRWTGKVVPVEEHLLDPLRWKTPRRIFVNSMSDLFHENLPDEAIDMIFAVMALCPQHQFQILTKRPERQLRYVDSACGRIADRVMEMRKARGDMGCVGPLPHLSPGSTWWPLANVWLGVSVEDQATADELIPLLQETPAAVRWVSAEPLLGPIDLCCVGHEVEEWDGVIDALRGFTWIEEWLDDFGKERRRHRCQTVPKLDWVVVGGESGTGARPMHPDWARSLRDQCQTAGVPFLFKQWGEWCPAFQLPLDGDAVPKSPDIFRFENATVQRFGKRVAGRELDGRTWDEFPEGR